MLFRWVIMILAGNVMFCLGEETMTIPNNGSLGTNIVESVQNEEMRKVLLKNIKMMKEAKKDLELIQTKIAEGKLEVKNNNGIWQAIVEDQKMLKLARCQSKNGPINFLMKRVWTDSSHKNEIHELGYEMYFGTNGLVNMFMRRDGENVLKYYPDGRLKRFSVKTDDGQYSVEWSPDGNFKREGKGKGLIGKLKEK